jgi:hypothetical protein
MTEKEKKLKRMVRDFQKVASKHRVVVDKYVPFPDEPAETRYFFKLQFDDIQIDIEKLFSVVYHGPPRSVQRSGDK